MKIKIAGVILRTQTIKICVQKNNSGDLVSRCNTDPLLGRLFQFSNIFFDTNGDRVFVKFIFKEFDGTSKLIGVKYRVYRGSHK